MNPPPVDNNLIVDTNENKLMESNTNESIPNSVSTDYEMDTPSETPSEVPTEMPSEEMPSEEMPSEEMPSEEMPSEVPYETQPIPVTVPIKNENEQINTESKTKKNYEAFINKVNKTKNQFTHKRKEIMKWDDKQKHEWRTKLSNTLIDIVRKSKNSQTHKIHHTQLSRMRNEFNHYLNRLSSSKSSKKSRQEQKI